MLTKKDAIEATIAGWSQYVRERITDIASLEGKLLLVEAEAIMFIAPMSDDKLILLGTTRDECRDTAYRFAPMLQTLFFGRTAGEEKDIR